jgi:hypothetical protein
MPYGTIKVDNITFTDNSVDKTVSLSGLIQNPTFTGNVTVTGTISGDVIRGGTTISGVTVTGTTANFVSGVFTTQVSGATIIATTGTFTSLTGTTTTGTTANFVSGVFTTQVSGATITGTTVSTTTGSFVSLTGTTATFTSGIIASGTAALPSLAILSDPNTGIYSPGADQLAISTNGTGRLFVDASGNIKVSTGEIFQTSATSYIRLDGGTGSGTGANIIVFGESHASAPGRISLSAVGTGAIIASTGGAERMRLDSSGQLGLGTSSPGTNLDVNGTVRMRIAGGGTDRYVDIGSDGSGTTRFFNNYAGGGDFGFTWKIGASDRMALDSSGRLGIGTTSPSSTLSLGGNMDFKQSSNLSTTTGYLNINPSSTLILDGGSGASIDFKIGGADKAKLDSSGRLLVGTTDGSGGVSKLVVQGASNGSAVGVAQISYNGLSSAVLATDTDIGYLRFTDQGSNSGVFAQITASTDGTTGAGDYPGRLVFSTTPDGLSSPTGRVRISNTGLFVAFSSNTDCFRIHTSAAASTSDNLLLGRYGATGFDDGTATSIIIRSNGNVLNTNNSYGAISDIKLKENIVDANSQWDDLKALQVRNYNFKEGQTHTQIGLVAQEAELVSPGLVSESPDRDEEGNDLGTVTKSVNYSVLYMKAVKALQEAMERIEALEASNADILARLSALEGN